MSIKIPGPGGAPPVGVPGEGDVGGVKGKTPAGGAFADKLGGPTGPGGPGGPGGPKAPDALAAIAAELKAGKLTPRQAVDKLLELTVDKGAAAHLPAHVKEKIRADLEALLAGDPLLAQKARRIGLASGDGGEGEGEG